MSDDRKEFDPTQDDESPINDLPPELLCQVFDLLGLSAQKESMAVCRHWNEVLSTPRYLNTRFLQVTAEIAQETVSTECELYPAVEMDVARFRGDFELFRRYVFEENVAKNLEELHLRGEKEWLVRLLTACGELHLPRLRKLKVCSPLGYFQEPILLIAPKLKSFEIDSSKAGDFGDYLKQQLFDSIEELNVRIVSEFHDYSSIILDRNFKKLRRLKIVGSLSLIERSNFPRHISRLTHLELHLNTLPRNVLLLTPNLHTLKLAGFEIDISQIRPLKSLKVLALKVLNPRFKITSMVDTPIELPNLVELNVDIEIAPNFITENLHMLNAEVDRISLVSRTTLEEYFDRIRPQLQVASFDFANFSCCPLIIDLIFKLTNLKSLRLQNALASEATLKRLFAQIKLRQAEFLNCSTSRYEGGFYANTKKTYKFFTKLKARYMDCVFSVPNLL